MIKFGIYSKLRRLIPDLEEMRAPRRLVSPSKAELNVELLFTQASQAQLVMRHSGSQIGVQPSLAVVLMVDFERRTATATAYQDAFGYRQVQPDVSSATNQATEDGINLFLDQWLSDLVVSSYAHQCSYG